MSGWVKWWSRATAAVVGAVITLALPAYAWAESTGAVEAVRYRRRGFGGGLFGGICCIVVIGIVVLVVWLISRNRKRG